MTAGETPMATFWPTPGFKESINSSGFPAEGTLVSASASLVPHHQIQLEKTELDGFSRLKSEQTSETWNAF